MSELAESHATTSEPAKDIGVEIALWAKNHVRKLKKYSMD
jgi:hypothetical protein